MANMRMDKNPMPEQDPVVRAGNFDEVALGYTPEMAMDEAKRCLNCHNMPCRTGCPVSVRIPEFIAKVAEGDFDAAYEIITSTNSLPAVCGRVCPQEKQCESKCVRGIKGESVGIGRLERFVADYHMNKEVKDEVKAPNPTVTASRSSAPALPASPAQAICARWATTLPFLRHSTSPAAFWSTVFRSSVCPRRSLQPRSRTSRPWALRS